MAVTKNRASFSRDRFKIEDKLSLKRLKIWNDAYAASIIKCTQMDCRYSICMTVGLRFKPQ